MATDKPRFTITLEPETFSQVLDYKDSNHIATQSGAIQRLVELGIKDLIGTGRLEAQTKEQPADVGELSANEEKFFKSLHAMPDDQRSLALALCTALVKELVKHQRVESETKALVPAGSDH